MCVRVCVCVCVCSDGPNYSAKYVDESRAALTKSKLPVKAHTHTHLLTGIVTRAIPGL